MPPPVEMKCPACGMTVKVSMGWGKPKCPLCRAEIDPAAVKAAAEAPPVSPEEIALLLAPFIPPPGVAGGPPLAERGPQQELKAPLPDGVDLVAHYHHGSFPIPALLDKASETLFTRIGEESAKGLGLCDNAVIPDNWMHLTLRKKGKELIVCEPDFTKNPEECHIEDVSTTLELMVLHELMAKLTRTAPVRCSSWDTVTIGKGSMTEEYVTLEREGEPHGGQTGWVINFMDPARAQKVDAVKAYNWSACYELLKARPGMMKMLALPVGTRVYFKGETVMDVQDRSRKSLWLPEQVQPIPPELGGPPPNAAMPT
ncbi:MAG: hypothetical protein HYY93_06860 [Planctomycetes bacterium]|nr:hypothetical protein [Planctomycetota bacterium]